MTRMHGAILRIKISGDVSMHRSICGLRSRLHQGSRELILRGMRSGYRSNRCDSGLPQKDMTGF
jgi:hypothetical protein